MVHLVRASASLRAKVGVQLPAPTLGATHLLIPPAPGDPTPYSVPHKQLPLTCTSPYIDMQECTYIRIKAKKLKNRFSGMIIELIHFPS